MRSAFVAMFVVSVDLFIQLSSDTFATHGQSHTPFRSTLILSFAYVETVCDGSVDLFKVYDTLTDTLCCRCRLLSLLLLFFGVALIVARSLESSGNIGTSAFMHTQHFRCFRFGPVELADRGINTQGVTLAQRQHSRQSLAPELALITVVSAPHTGCLVCFCFTNQLFSLAYAHCCPFGNGDMRLTYTHWLLASQCRG